MIFKGFDYGKKLMKQVDAYRRLSLLQQGKRHPVLVKSLETYVKKFMTILENPGGSGNPGQFKNAAEVMVESALALQSTELTFAAFADMAARSRKVPVVPGLAGLVDRLLESPDENKKYRIALYNWRIIAGSLRPERRLKYLSERAHLNPNTDYWREYAAGWLQVLDKKQLERTDSLVLESLEDLHENRKLTGDMCTPLQLQCVEILLESGKARQAEELLFEMVADAQDVYELPRKFFTLVQELLTKRPDAGWEMHQITLDVAILDYAAGKHGFSVVEKLIQREQGKLDQLLGYLLNHEAFTKDKRLSAIAVSSILNSKNVDSKPYLDRWHAAYQQAGVDPPDEILQLIEAASVGEPVEIETLMRMLSGEPVPELTRQVQIKDTEEIDASGATDAAATFEAESESREDSVEADGADRETSGEEVVEEEFGDDELAEQLVILEPANGEEPDSGPPPEDGEVVDIETAQADEVEHEVPDQIGGSVPQDNEIEPAVEPPSEPDSLEEEEDPELAAILAKIHAPAIQPVDGEGEDAEDRMPARDDTEPQVRVLETEVVEAMQQPMQQLEAEQLDQDAQTVSADEASRQEPAQEPEGLPVPLLDNLESLPEIWQALDSWLGEHSISQGSAQLEQLLASGSLGEEAILEARLWLIEHLMAESLQQQANTHLERLRLPAGGDPIKLLDRINALVGDEPPAEVLPVIAQLALAAGEASKAFKAVAGLAPDDPRRGSQLVALDEWIVSQPEPSPELLMVLAKVQRELRDDPQAGFPSATTSSLLAADDVQLQGDYSGWVIALAPDVVHRERAQQAAFLTASEGHKDLLATALGEIEALAGALSEPPPREVLEWLDEIRPVVDEIEPGAEQQSTLLRWTKLYLNLASQIGEQERLQQVLSTAADLIAPEAAYLLVTELGHTLPAATRVRLECSALVRQGQWQQALDIALDPSSTPPEVVPLDTICAQLPEDALLRAGTRLSEYYLSQDDAAGQLSLIQQLRARSGNGGADSSEADSLLSFLDQQLQALCESAYLPAVRYRLEIHQDQDTAERASDLLALAQTGEGSAQEQLANIYPQLLNAGDQPGLLKDIAAYLARQCASDVPDEAVTLLAQSGLKIDQPGWALSEIQSLNLTASGVTALGLTGELALRSQDPEQALEIARELVNHDAFSIALPLIEQVIQQQPEDPGALAAYFSLLVHQECRDLPKATGVLLKLSQLYQREYRDIAQQLEPLGREIDTALVDDPDSNPAQYLKLAFAALTGNQKHAALLVQQIMQSGEGASGSLLSLFEQLALEDAELPAPLIIAWGQALFDAGRLEDALARLAGLRDAVGNYPEYIALLEEIKERGGGPGASMQLGEAYLRVHLWQRSAEEYAAALSEDEALAEPILTQLRHHAALDPNPMKYPLHVLGLRAVACSARQADWGWALSALAWLKGRWSAEELYERAAALWERQEQLELDLEPEHRFELLLILQSLAASIGDIQLALDYLSQAWEGADEESQPALIEALAEYDESRLPDVAELRYKLTGMHFQAALSAQNIDEIIRLAGKLVEFGDEGRAFALAGLEKCKEQASDPLRITLARLKLLDLQDTAGVAAFLNEVKALPLDQLPREQAFNLVQMTVGLTQAQSGNKQLVELLLSLFAQLGDLARVWQLGLNLLADPEFGELAVQALEATAEDEFAVQQQVALVEIHQQHGDYTAVAKALTRLGWGNLAAFSTQAEALAEALLDTPAAQEARRWLITWYRERNEEALAADHVVWAHANGDQQPAGWIEEAKTGDLLYRAACLRELSGDTPAARRTLERARKLGAADSIIQATICLKLSEMAEGDGSLERAVELAKESAAALPQEPMLMQQVARLERLQAEEKVVAAQQLEDSGERTLEIAAIYRKLGDFAQAINELQNGLGRGQTQPELFIELAECFTERGDLNLARRAFNEVLRRLEQVHDVEASLRALYGLAVAEERLGNPDEAIRNLEQILVLRQNYRDSREWLNRLYSKDTTQSQTGAKESILSEIFNLLGQPEGESDKPEGES